MLRCKVEHSALLVLRLLRSPEKRLARLERVSKSVLCHAFRLTGHEHLDMIVLVRIVIWRRLINSLGVTNKVDFQ